MSEPDPSTELHAEFSSPDATATAWSVGWQAIEQAEIFWISTVRADGRPHVTPLIAVSIDGRAYFTTGPSEQKALNLAANPHCVLLTGCNKLASGLDVAIEGSAIRVVDLPTLQRVADAFNAKYPAPFHFTLGDLALTGDGGDTLVFRVEPAKAWGFGRGASYSQTRWRFKRD